jgi:hypothetical protein
LAKNPSLGALFFNYFNGFEIKRKICFLFPCSLSMDNVFSEFKNANSQEIAQYFKYILSNIYKPFAGKSHQVVKITVPYWPGLSYPLLQR